MKAIYEEEYFSRLKTVGYWPDIQAKIIRKFIFSSSKHRQESRLKILEIGCGCGFLLGKLQRMGLEAYGLDISYFALRKARQNLMNISLIRGNAKNLPFIEKCFDIVVMFEVIEHLKNPLQAFRECRRVLKDCGYIILTTPNKYGLRNLLVNLSRVLRIDDLFFPLDKEDIHVNIFNINEMRNLLKKGGFNNISILFFQGGIYLPKIYERRISCCLLSCYFFNFPFATSLLAFAAK